RLTHRVHYSQSFREELQALCQKEGIDYHTLKRIVATRWNTYAVMFDSLVKMKPVVKKFCRNHTDLPSFDSDDWELLEQLEEVLRPFISFTQRMSGTKRPLIYQVIPLMDKINTMLEDFFDDTTKEDSIHFAIKAGVKILDKYYASTDDSLIYRAAMSMFLFT
ncbi:hypothetical protein K435DRAFT_668172, partial [Dendrothele bispora CBS 962.96]